VADIFDEVRDDLRAERALSLFKRYGWLLLAAAVAAVLGAGIWQGLQWRRQQQAEATAAAYLAAARQAMPVSGMASDSGRHAALDGFSAVAATAPQGYRTLARLRMASLQWDLGDKAAALTTWDQVAADSEAQPALRDVASLLWVQHQIDTGDAGEIRRRITPLAAEGAPFQALAEESLGLLDLREGNREAAETRFKALAAGTAISPEERRRASDILQRLGG
jgi:hypothetical protein